MRILMLGWELPPHNSGGLGVACYYISKALAAKGATIDFVVPYRADHSEIDHMKVHCATSLSPSLDTGFGAYDTKFTKERLICDGYDMHDIQVCYKRYVKKLARDIQPDVIHAHDWLTTEAGIVAKEACNAPLVVHVHATEFDRSGSDMGNPMIHEIEYNGLVAADKIIAVSNITKQKIIDKYAIPADKIDVVHNAIDASYFNDNHSCDMSSYEYLEALKTEGYTLVTYLGRATIQKGLTHLLNGFAKASSKYDKIVLLLAGDGEQLNELIKLSADLSISDKVFFPGFVRGKQLRDAYSLTDIFVMSSVCEPFGLTALEAAHYGNAIILTKQSGVGEILRSVLRYDYWDEDLLANQLIGVATSDALRDSLKNDVKSEYTKISWNDVARVCLNIYNKLQRALTG